LREAHNIFRIAPEAGTDRTAVSCGHFWRRLLVTKGGKDFLAGNSRREGRDFPKESIGKFFFSQIFSCAFGLIQKHQKIKQREK